MATDLIQDPTQLSPDELAKRIAELQADIAAPEVEVAPAIETAPIEESALAEQPAPEEQVAPGDMTPEQLAAKIASLQEDISAEEPEEPASQFNLIEDVAAGSVIGKAKVGKKGSVDLDTSKTAAPAFEPEPEFWENVGDIAGDVALQTLSGAREGLISLSHTILPMYGIDPETLPKPREQFDAPEGSAGEVAKEISRFVSGFVVGGAPLKGIGMAVNGPRFVKTLVEGSTRGFVGDYGVTEFHHKTLATLAKENGADNFLTNFLAIDEDDSLSIRKFKGATEGVLFGTTLSSVFEFGVKPAAKALSTAVKGDKGRLGKAIDDAFTFSEESMPRYEAVVTDNGNIALSARPQSSGQQVMDDVQTLQIQDTVDRKMKILAERREAHEESKKLFEPMQTRESLATRREIGQDSNVIKMEMKTNKKAITVAEKELEVATKKLENAPIPKAVLGGIKTPDLSPTAPTREAIQARGPISNIYEELLRSQQAAVKKLTRLNDEKLSLSENLINNQYLKRELTEDAQTAAALRNKEALRIKGPLPPRYEEITLADLTPIAAKIDPATKARVPRRLAQPLRRLSEEQSSTPLATNEYDALVDDVIDKRRPIDKLQRVLRNAGSFFILRSADSMKSLAQVSPTAAKLSNMIRHDTTSLAKQEGQYSYTESVQFTSGKYKTRMKDALAEGLDDSDFTMFGNLTPETNLNVVRYLRGVDLDNIPAKHKAVGEKLRKVLVDFHTSAGEEVPVGFINNFFPRKWNAGDMYKGKKEVRAKLAAAGYSPQRVEEIERKLVNEMQEDLGIQRSIARGDDFAWKGSKFLSLGSRSLDIDELSFEKFLSNDVINVLDDYFEKGARKIEYNKKFGYGGQKVKVMLGDILTESRANGRPIMPEERVALEALLRNLQGMQKFGNTGDIVNETVGTAMRVMHLGLATLISFGEAFIPFGKAGFLQASKGLATAVTSVPQHYVAKVLKGVPEPEAYAAAQRVNLALSAAAAERLSSLMGNEVMHATTRKINNAYFKATLLTEWVKMVQVAAHSTGRSVIIDNLSVLSKGTRVPGRKALLQNELKSLGVDVDAGLKWVAGGKDPKHPFVEMIDRGSLRFANDSALMPDSTIKPFIQSRPEAMLLTQFKAYPVAFANVVLRDYARGLTGQGTTGAVNKLYAIGTKGVRATIATSLILGATGYGQDLRNYIKYGENGNPYDAESTEGERMLDLVDQSGLMGHAAVIKHAYDADRYNQEPILSWFGPAFGKGAKVVEGIIDKENRGDIFAKLAVNSIPNALPTEVLMRLNNKDGSKATREALRASLSGQDVQSDNVESENVSSTTVYSKGGFDVWGAVKRLYPEQLEELMNSEDDGDDDGDATDQTVLPDQAFIDDFRAGNSDIKTVASPAPTMSSGSSAERNPNIVTNKDNLLPAKDTTSGNDSLLDRLREPVNEGFRLSPYVVGNEDGGITTATGVDLGQWTEDGLTKLGVPASTIDKLRPGFGLKGDTAKEALPSVQALTQDEADKLDNVILEESVSTLQDKFGDRWNDLTDTEKFISLSTYHQYGPVYFTQESFTQLKNGKDEELRSNLKDWGDKTDKHSAAINARYARYAADLEAEDATTGEEDGSTN